MMFIPAWWKYSTVFCEHYFGAKGPTCNSACHVLFLNRTGHISSFLFVQTMTHFPPYLIAQRLRSPVSISSTTYIFFSASWTWQMLQNRGFLLSTLIHDNKSHCCELLHISGAWGGDQIYFKRPPAIWACFAWWSKLTYRRARDFSQGKQRTRQLRLTQP